MIQHLIKLVWNKKRSNFLMILEIALAFVALFAVMTYVIDNYTENKKPVGFRTEDILTIPLNYTIEDDSTSVVEKRKTLIRELNAIPEVISASFAFSCIAFEGCNWNTSNDETDEYHFETAMRVMDQYYAKTVDINITEGRWYNEDDFIGKYTPIVVNQVVVDEVFNGESPLGKVVDLWDDCIVVGVVDHHKYQDEFVPEKQVTFYPLEVTPPMDISNMLYVHMQSDAPIAAEEKISETIRSVANWDHVIKDHDVTRKLRARETWVPMVALMCIGGFLVFNVALGLFGVLWHSISKRKGEIGLRMAMGATGGNIIAQFVGEIVLIATLGLLLGAFFAVQFPLLEVFDITNSIYWKAGLFSLLLIYGLVLICALLPSTQASNLAPAIALHEE